MKQGGDFVNRRDADVLLAIYAQAAPKQRDLAKACGCSLGAVNASVQALLEEDYIDRQLALTEKSQKLFLRHRPKRAILLAAGYGLRQSRDIGELPKALLQVRSQRLIDRLIEQLHAVGIQEIYVVVGFEKEQFEYLIDRYGVELIVNAQYAEKNNLHSLALAEKHLDNCYVVPCDLWCAENPFRSRELYSWYMVSTQQSTESSVRINRKQELAIIPYDAQGNEMIGISYLLPEDADIIRSRLAAMVPDRRCKGYFWEEALYESGKLRIGPRLVAAGSIVEINSFSDLMELNNRSADIAKAQICRLLNTSAEQIQDLTLQKRGMTNATFRFVHKGRSCIIRIPMGRSSIRIDRNREAAVYDVLKGRGICDEVICFDRDSGVKLSLELESMRPCDLQNKQDVLGCMQTLRRFHEAALEIDQHFDLFADIDYYESLRQGTPSLYADYGQTKANILSLRSFIDSQDKQLCLAHIDAVAENFLIPGKAGDSRAIRLIDWEHAAMADPHVDIAMFCLQALYDRSKVDRTIDSYFPEGCSHNTRLKIYCYIAAGGLLWSNWCEQEIRRGAEFGAYSLRQYRYAKEYYKIVQEERNHIEGEFH